MPGLIKSEDIALVKERAQIEDVVREHVNLRTAGIGSLKGLCPFHDEKTPSFTIRPAMGTWHCFGCGEGGDVLSFVMKIDHLTFTEAVERLAGKAGVELHYEEGGARPEEPVGRRTRLVEAHRVAQEFYHESLLRNPEARAGRDFLRARGFDSAAAATFLVGYAPRAWEALTDHLRSKGFSSDEIVLSGLGKPGRRGPYDSFRGRLVWPIRDITGDPVGFGARRLFDDDQSQAKYLNTAETPIYRKTSVLYALDLAKRAIARDRQVVVVEGYTDVMACHLAGVDTAVATCGTAFGVDHIKTLRRILRDEATGAPARTVFTFDGDKAGQAAAMKAFGDDQRWASQSYVAVAPGGMDPCELRLERGPEAVKALIDDAVPMFEFAVRTTMARFDLDTAEGRVGAMRAAAPIVVGIRDKALQPEYIRTVAGWLGVEVGQVADEVARAAHRPAEQPRGRPREAEREAAPPDETGLSAQRPDRRDPVVELEHEFLQVVIQWPRALPQAELDVVPDEAFTAAAHRTIWSAVRAAGSPEAAASTATWFADVMARLPIELHALTSELSVEPVRAAPDPRTGGPDAGYCAALLNGLRESALRRRIADLTSALRRAEDGDVATSRALATELTGLHKDLQNLRERAIG